MRAKSKSENVQSLNSITFCISTFQNKILKYTYQPYLKEWLYTTENNDKQALFAHFFKTQIADLFSSVFILLNYVYGHHGGTMLPFTSQHNMHNMQWYVSLTVLTFRSCSLFSTLTLTGSHVQCTAILTDLPLTVCEQNTYHT